MICSMAALAVELVRPELFGTLTFRPVTGRGSFTEVGVGGAERALGRYFGQVRSFNPDARMFVALEAHRDRVSPHGHYLLGGLVPGVAAAVEAARFARSSAPGADAFARGPLFAVAAAPSYIWRWWFDRYGMARVEAVDGAHACSMYVGKYVNKELGPFKMWPRELKGTVAVKPADAGDPNA